MFRLCGMLFIFFILNAQANEYEFYCIQESNSIYNQEEFGNIKKITDHYKADTSDFALKVSQCSKEWISSKEIGQCIENTLLGFFKDGLGGAAHTVSSFIKESIRIAASASAAGQLFLGLLGVETTQEKIQELVEKWGPSAAQIAQSIQKFITDSKYRSQIVQ